MRLFRSLAQYAFFSCLVLCCCAGSFGAAPLPTNSENSPVLTDQMEGQALRESAMAAYEKEDYEKALPLLQDYLTLRRNDKEITGRAGFAAKETGAYELALQLLKSLVTQDDSNYYHWWWLSDAQRLLGHYEEALASIEQARDLAPENVRSELNDYVQYTAKLKDQTPSWDNFDQHLDFSQRHREHRRVRQQVEEYARALAVAPDYGLDNQDAIGRLAWLYQELAIQYLYMDDPDPAIDYLMEAEQFLQELQASSELMRQKQYLAIAWRQKAENNSDDFQRNMQRSADYWKASLKTALETEDVVYQRYTQGRLLETQCTFLPLSEPAVSTLRESNLKEVPWQGPINEFSVAEAVYGEGRCRAEEGDYAGARILLEMALPYFEQSQYLSDKQRLVEIYLELAYILTQQDHPSESLLWVEKAVDVLPQTRSQVSIHLFKEEGKTFIQEAIATAKLRAYLALDDKEKAFELTERCYSDRLSGLPAKVLMNEERRSNASSEIYACTARISMLEGQLAKANLVDDREAAATIEARLKESHERIGWLEKTIQLPDFQLPNKQSRAPMTLQEMQNALDDNTAYVVFFSDPWGSVLLGITPDSFFGDLMDINEKNLHAPLVSNDHDGALESGRGLRSVIEEPPFSDLLTKTIMVGGDSRFLPFIASLFQGYDASVDIHVGSSLTPVPSDTTNKNSTIRYVQGREEMSADFFEEEDDDNAIRALTGDALVLPKIISDIQSNEILHLGCTLYQSSPDLMQCELLFGDGSEERRLPLYRLVAMKLPARLVVLDWVFAEDSPAPDPALLTLVPELFRYAGAASVLVIDPEKTQLRRNAFFSAFHKGLRTGDTMSLFQHAYLAKKEMDRDHSFYWYGLSLVKQ